MNLPPPSINPIDIQQLLELQASTMPWLEGFYSFPFSAGPVYQGWGPGMDQADQPYQDPSQYEVAIRAPSSGPSRYQRNRGSRKAEAQYLNNTTHESSGTITGNRSTGTHPGNARIGASDNTRVGKVWRTPPLKETH
jgi:hypothetical protein